MNEEQYAKIIADLASNEKEHESFRRRLNDHDKLLEGQNKILVAMEKQSGAIQSMNDSMGRMEKKVEKIDGRVAAMEKEPADKWKKITWEIIKWVAVAILAGVVGYVVHGVVPAP